MRDSATSTTASTAVYQSVSRTRTESSIAFPGGGRCLGAIPWRNIFVSRLRRLRIVQQAKNVSCASASMEQGLAGIRVNFPAHAIHVNFDQIREGIKRLIPHVLGDFGASHYAASVAGQILEQRIFLGGKGHTPARPGHALRGGIQDKVGDGTLAGAQLTGAAQQGAKARQQFTKFERLRQVN